MRPRRMSLDGLLPGGKPAAGQGAKDGCGLEAAVPVLVGTAVSVPNILRHNLGEFPGVAVSKRVAGFAPAGHGVCGVGPCGASLMGAVAAQEKRVVVEADSQFDA